jgi:hypothetical protein
VSSSFEPRPESSVLEKNLELLFSRAYAPVRPSIAFRARLASRIEQEIAARSSATAVAPRAGSPAFTGTPGLSGSPRSLRWFARAAAAVLLVALGALAWRRFAASGAPADESLAATLERIAAGGRSAVSIDGARARPVSDDEMAQGLEYGEGSLALWTAPSSSLPIWLGGSGRLTARPAAHVDLTGAPQHDLDLALERGAIDLERYAAGGAWRIGTREGTISLERGTIAVSVRPDAARSGADEPRVAVLLRSGAAHLDANGKELPLLLGVEGELRGGQLVAANAPAIPADESSQREPLAASTAGPEESRPPAIEDKATLTVRISFPPGIPVPASYSLSLLREERLPLVSIPDVHQFESSRREVALEGLRTGSYTIFAQAAGFAVWQRASIELRASGASVAIDLQRGQRVGGRVVDESGRPIEGAVVLSQRDSPTEILPLAMERPPQGWIAAAVSGPNGTFEIDSLSRGVHVLRATHAGFGAAWSEAIDLGSAVAYDEIELRLQRGGTVFGRVTHKDGTIWSGAILIASRIDYRFDLHCLNFGQATADADGAFTIDDLPAGPYVVLNALEPKVDHVASPHVTQVNVAAGARVEVDLTSARKGTRIDGRIVAMPGSPSSAHDASLGSAHDASLGSAHDASHGLAHEASHDSAHGADPDTKLGAELDVILEAHTARYSRRRWQSERAGADGSFRFLDVAPGLYDVYVSTEMGKSFVVEDLLDVPSVPVLPYALRLGSGRIHGRVVERASEHGIANGAVVLELEKDGAFVFAGKVTCDSEGRFEAQGLPSGLYRVTAYAMSGHFGPETREGLLVDSTDRDVATDIALSPGASLDVKVVDESGRALPDALVTFTDDVGRAVHFTPEDFTDARGEFSIDGIRPGRWTVSASRDGWKANGVTIDLLVGESRAVGIVLSPAQPH